MKNNNNYYKHKYVDVQTKGSTCRASLNTSRGWGRNSYNKSCSSASVWKPLAMRVKSHRVRYNRVVPSRTVVTAEYCKSYNNNIPCKYGIIITLLAHSHSVWSLYIYNIHYYRIAHSCAVSAGRLRCYDSVAAAAVISRQRRSAARVAGLTDGVKRWTAVVGDARGHTNGTWVGQSAGYSLRRCYNSYITCTYNIVYI